MTKSINPVYYGMITNNPYMAFGNDPNQFQIHPTTMAEDLYTICNNINKHSTFVGVARDRHISDVIFYLNKKIVTSVRNIGLDGAMRGIINNLDSPRYNGQYMGAAYSRRNAYSLLQYKNGNSIRVGFLVYKFYESNYEYVHLPLKAIYNIQNRNFYAAEYLMQLAGIIAEKMDILDITNDPEFIREYDNYPFFTSHSVESARILLKHGRLLEKKGKSVEFIKSPPPFLLDSINRVYLGLKSLYEFAAFEKFRLTKYHNVYLQEVLNCSQFPERKLIQRYKFCWTNEKLDMIGHDSDRWNMNLTEPFSETQFYPIDRKTCFPFHERLSMKTHDFMIKFRRFHDILYGKSLHYSLYQNRNYENKKH